MAKLFSLFVLALFGVGQVSTQTVPELSTLLDLNGDEFVNVADVVLLAGFVLSGQVLGQRICMLALVLTLRIAGWVLWAGLEHPGRFVQRRASLLRRWCGFR